MRPQGLVEANYRRRYEMKGFINLNTDLINFLIKMRRERKKEQNVPFERPFLEISLENPLFYEEEEKNDPQSEKNDIIEMDI